jgi:hypothetical protein
MMFGRACQFFQGDIYRPNRMWSNIWGLNDPGKDSQCLPGVNPKYLTTAGSCGILGEMSPFKNHHARLSISMIAHYCPYKYF